MKTWKRLPFMLGCIVGLLLSAAAQEAPLQRSEPPAPDSSQAADTNQPPAAAEEANPDQERPSADASEAPQPESGTEPAQPRSGQAQPPAAADGKPVDKAAPSPAGAVKETSTAAFAPPSEPSADGESGLRMNFRGVPLEMVLNYMSDAADFIVNLETEVKGKVDVWSNQPLTKEEAVTLLDTVLNRNGYAAIRNGRTLTIVSREDAKKRDIPVISGSDPETIPKTDEVITQIIPVRYISATTLTKNLEQLLPSSTSLTANEGGNALVIADTRTNIRRVAEIVKALDTAISSISAIRVFRLDFADARAVATLIRDLFQQDTNQRSGQNPMQQLFRGFRGGPGGEGGQGGNQQTGSGRVSPPRVVAVADEYGNAVVVSAPEEQMPIIDSLVKQLDQDVKDITELRVFRLRHSDPQETADLLTTLFADSTSTSGSQGFRGQLQFGGRFGGPFGRSGAANSASQTSARMQKQTRVVAVPDLRTRSVIVSAARDLQEQIAKMIEQIDSDPARKQKVFVYSVENTDPQAVQSVLQTLFPDQNYGMNRNSRSMQQQNNSQLNNRSTQNRNQMNRNTGAGSGFGGSSFGGGMGGTTGRQ